eukprot:15794910-Heterocapsa_arctica.AAC.1
MVAAAAVCQPGAGELFVNTPPSRRGARRWVLRFLRRRGGWVARAAIDASAATAWSVEDPAARRA